MGATRLPLPSGESLAVRLDRSATGTPTELCLLYLHGFGSSQAGEKATHFRARAAAAALPFCSLDFRGHGESDGALGATTLARNLEDVAAVRRHLAEAGFQGFVLVGSSMGGATALLETVENPAGVAACLAIAPAVGLARAVERLAGTATLEAWRREGTLRYRGAQVEADLDWAFAEDVRRRDFADVARRLAVPALLLQGRRDASVDFRDVLDFAAAAPPGLVDLVLYGDGDHRLVDRLDELWQRMLDFLARRALLDPASAVLSAKAKSSS